MKHNIRKLSFTLLLSLCMLSGCGKEMSQELKVYKSSMETFCNNISYINDEINRIDSESETAVSDLLGYLDTLDDQFLQMAELEVPSEFEAVESLADEASTNMTEAVTYYHQAYESDVFNQNYADAANEYYQRANIRLSYILDLLHGKDVSEITAGTQTSTETDSESGE